MINDEFRNAIKHLLYPCCEAVRRIEGVPGDATTLVGGACPIHGRTSTVFNKIADERDRLIAACQAAITELEDFPITPPPKSVARVLEQLRAAITKEPQ